MEEVSQIRPRLSQGRAGSTNKVKTLIPTSFNKPSARAKKKTTKSLSAWYT